MKANWVCSILPTNYLLKHIIEDNIGGRIELTLKQGRRENQLLDDLRKRENILNGKMKN
jgi:uncharacterized protein Veg